MIIKQNNMWNYICQSKKHIVLYGTGNAADKVINELERRNCSIAGIFASDGFVRNRDFRGYHVLSYSEAREKFQDMLVLLCFGSHLSDVIDNIKKIEAEQELLAPDFPVEGSALFSSEYALQNQNSIKFVSRILADNQSRKVLDNVIKYKITGKLPFLYDCETCDEENWSLLDIEDNENFLDIGAYTGDTIKMFLSQSGNRYSSIMAFEPDARNFRKLSQNCSGMKNIRLFNAAAGFADGKIPMSKNTGRGTKTSVSGYYSDVIACDGVLADCDVSLIKIDAEGMECDIIDGLEKTIEKNRPRMLIAAYHKNDDLWKIPEKILKIYPDYKIYLRKTPCIPAWEVNFYFC